MLAGGMVAFGAHKMSERHAKQIEERTGVHQRNSRTTISKRP
jgi:hypothetical protein